MNAWPVSTIRAPVALPLWVFLFVYLVTCVAAALPLAFDYHPLRIMVGYFAGLFVPSGFDPSADYRYWLLLIGCPFAVALGYLTCSRLFHRAPIGVDRKDTAREPTLWVPWGAFLASACVGLASLSSEGAFSQLASWGDYGDWVLNRWALFSNLSYFEFTNLYVWLPITCSWLICATLIGGQNVRWPACLAIGFACLLMLATYQKKALLVLLLFVLFATFLCFLRMGVKRTTISRLSYWSMAGLALIYLTMVVLPVWSETSSRLDQEASSTSGVVSAAELEAILGEDRAAHVAAYALLSPFSRTSISTFYYLSTFPDQHAFYGLDIGLDILGLGNMPDDNLVVWKAMYPNLPGGSASAPFQFVLYSQVGLGGALLGCLLTGALVALAWGCALSPRRSAPTGAVLGSLVLMFAVFLAIDSPRNALVSSYGLLWGVVLALMLEKIASIVGRRQPSRATFQLGPHISVSNPAKPENRQR